MAASSIQQLSASAILCFAASVLPLTASTGAPVKAPLVRSARTHTHAAVLSPDGEVQPGQPLASGDKQLLVSAKDEQEESAGTVDADALKRYTKYPHDCPGDNLEEFPPESKTEAECATVCDGNPKCTGFTFSARGQCYPKELEPCRLDMSKSEPDFKFYSKNKPSNMKKVLAVLSAEDVEAADEKVLAAYSAYTHDCPGENILELEPGKATTKAGCAVYCNNDLSCKGFTYSDKGACYLKAASCGFNKDRVEDGSFIFYSKGKPLRVFSEAAPPQELQVEDAEALKGFTKYTHDCPGDNLAEYSAGTKTKGECATLCKTAGADCAGFTYSNLGACYHRKEACRFDQDHKEDTADYLFFSKGAPPAE